MFSLPYDEYNNFKGKHSVKCKRGKKGNQQLCHGFNHGFSEELNLVSLDYAYTVEDGFTKHLHR